MNATIFCAPLDAVDNADQIIREIIDETNRMARPVFGWDAHASIHIGHVFNGETVMNMRDHIFCAPLDAVDNADQVTREIIDEINRMARPVFGWDAHASIHLGRWKWVVSIHGRNYETLAEGIADTLVDALHGLKEKIDAKRAEADNLNRTLGIWA